MSLEALSNLASLQEPFVFQQQQNEDRNSSKNGSTENNTLTRQASVPTLPQQQLIRQSSTGGVAPRYVYKIIIICFLKFPNLFFLIIKCVLLP